jgi:ParB-like chromosome segregation protein Spo0J
MRVVDGVHRLRALELCGVDTIEVVDIDECDPFIRAVDENVLHSLPLSVDERTVAAFKIIELRAQTGLVDGSKLLPV